MEREPETLMEAVVYFSDADRTFELAKELRWPNGVHCPTCGRTDVRFIATRKMWECKEKHPRKQFSVKVGTIFEDSPLGLDKWFVAIWQEANCKNGISSYEIARALGITQKSAWHMGHRIRLAMQYGSFEKMGGGDKVTEADESYVGGLAKNMHETKRAAKIAARGNVDKAIVFGILERTGDKPSRVRAKHIRDANTKTLRAELLDSVHSGSRLMTDSARVYQDMNQHFIHEQVNHMGEYARGDVNTNGIENFWSLLKRGIKGTYVNVEPYHLGRYVDEQVFRFNERKDTDRGRFMKLLGSVIGKRLTYKELIAHGEPTPA